MSRARLAMAKRVERIIQGWSQKALSLAIFG
jgi:hypothetical protein